MINESSLDGGFLGYLSIYTKALCTLCPHIHSQRRKQRPFHRRHHDECSAREVFSLFTVLRCWGFGAASKQNQSRMTCTWCFIIIIIGGMGKNQLLNWSNLRGYPVQIPMWSQTRIETVLLLTHKHILTFYPLYYTFALITTTNVNWTWIKVCALTTFLLYFDPEKE